MLNTKNETISILIYRSSLSPDRSWYSDASNLAPTISHSRHARLRHIKPRLSQKQLPPTKEQRIRT